LQALDQFHEKQKPLSHFGPHAQKRPIVRFYGVILGFAPFNSLQRIDKINFTSLFDDCESQTAQSFQVVIRHLEDNHTTSISINQLAQLRPVDTFP
jgi:hypothetical protein